MELVSPFIIAGAAAWVSAQVLKYVILTIKGRKVNALKQLYLSGSMPSAHSATVVAVLVVIGFQEGINSSIFGLALLFSAVVMYDAVMVRRSSGEQGESLTALIKEQKSKVRLPRVARGHTPPEVVVGALLGWGIGLLVVYLA